MLVGVDSVEAGEDHGLDFFEAGQGFDGGTFVVGDGVANLRVGNVLAVGDDEAHFTGNEFLDLDGLGCEYTQGFYLQHASVPPQTNLLLFLQGAFKHAGQDHDTAVGIEPGIKNQGLQMVSRRTLWRRHALHDGFENIGYALTGFRADEASV